ncbi:aminomethyltransferase [Faecalicatena contorta]|uniref:Aminomethyltransferase n=1 Tax=Faecalicatena contorta TaxID=39482 RepID=A0A315ZVS7_9FIRM|nr:hypothetical protein [Faecalicatena contorta]PWJ49635.1 aminomethyltransferase [Faecalicatena contorta]SUQ14353.1 aminomethyltransferase [Faecalicatena contorta]
MKGAILSMDLKTPLYDEHVKAGGKIVSFAGYLLPVQYGTGVIKEHMAVRTQAGLFDVSHMGEILCEGKDALANLQMLLTNNFDNLVDGQARYSPMCTEEGGTVDDLIVYKKSDNHYFIVVNAANKDKDYQWMINHKFGDAVFTDVSEEYAQLAVQGPKAMEIIRKLTREEEIPSKYYHAVFDAQVAGISCIISKTGYTGEDGVELYFKSKDAARMWNTLLENGKEDIGIIYLRSGPKRMRIRCGIISPTKPIGPAKAVVAPHSNTPARAPIPLVNFVLTPKPVAISSPKARLFNEGISNMEIIKPVSR